MRMTVECWSPFSFPTLWFIATVTGQESELPNHCLEVTGNEIILHRLASLTR